MAGDEERADAPNEPGATGAPVAPRDPIRHPDVAVGRLPASALPASAPSTSALPASVPSASVPSASALTASVAKRAGLVLRAYRSESAIYGVILVSALIAIGWEQETDAEVLGFTLGTVVVFWLAHVYAGAIAHEEPDPSATRWQAIGHSVRASVVHSMGLLVAMVLPTIFLGLAALGWVDEYVAYYSALWVGVAVLAVIGWLASARRGSPWFMRLLSAVLTACLGLLVIWLSALVH